jgi:hypothetical protein
VLNYSLEDKDEYDEYDDDDHEYLDDEEEDEDDEDYMDPMLLSNGDLYSLDQRLRAAKIKIIEQPNQRRITLRDSSLGYGN